MQDDVRAKGTGGRKLPEQSAKSDREYFDGLAERWDEIVRHDPQRIETLLRALPFRPGMRLLDVGCGTGVLIPHLLKRAPAGLTELDVSPAMLAVAEKKFGTEGIEYLCSDVFDLRGREFDAIVCYSMFPHFRDKAAAVVHMVSLLAPGGFLAIAHSQSRAAINALHDGVPVEEARLPSAEVIQGYFQAAGLQSGATLDGELFLCCAAKGGGQNLSGF